MCYVMVDRYIPQEEENEEEERRKHEGVSEIRCDSASLVAALHQGVLTK